MQFYIHNSFINKAIAQSLVLRIEIYVILAHNLLRLLNRNVNVSNKDVSCVIACMWREMSALWKVHVTHIPIHNPYTSEFAIKKIFFEVTPFSFDFCLHGQ